MTNFTLSKSLRAGLSAACLSAALIMGGCGPKNKGGAPVISADTAPLGLSGLSDKDFARHFSVPKRKTSNAEAQEALAGLGLTESNPDGLSWANQTGSDGNYTFSDLKSTSNQGIITIANAKLFGVHMQDGNATFDRADFGNLTIKSDEVTLKVDAMSLARPTTATATAIIKSLEDLGKDTNLDFGDEAKFGFGALSMNALDFNIKDPTGIITGTIDQLVWGLDDSTKRADVKLENVDFNIPQKGSSVASVVTLKSLSARGFKSEKFTQGLTEGAKGNASSLMGLLSNFNAYEQPYDSVKLEDFKFESEVMDIDLPKIEAAAKTKGDVTTITQVIAPMTLKVGDGLKDQNRQAYEMIQELGFDTMTFKTSQTTVLNKDKDTMNVKDGIFEMSDAFRLNYKYGASGLSAAAQSQGDQSAQVANILETMKINGMTLSLEDKSIIERGLKIAAQLRGKDAKSLKREMRAALTLAPLVARNDLEKEIASQLGDAFMNFVDDGGTLTVQLAPKSPLALSAFDNIENLSPEAIGFTARHDK